MSSEFNKNEKQESGNGNTNGKKSKGNLSHLRLFAETIPLLKEEGVEEDTILRIINEHFTLQQIQDHFEREGLTEMIRAWYEQAKNDPDLRKKYIDTMEKFLNSASELISKFEQVDTTIDGKLANLGGSINAWKSDQQRREEQLANEIGEKNRKLQAERKEIMDELKKVSKRVTFLEVLTVVTVIVISFIVIVVR